MKNLKVNLTLVVLLTIIWGWKFVEPGNSPEKNEEERQKVLAAGLDSFRDGNETINVDTLPLLSIMVELERDIEMIGAGIWRENYQMIKEGANNIANHPKIPPNEIEAIKAILGAQEFKSFVENDKLVHNKSLELAKAAENRNLDKSSQLFIDLERGCISCHLDYRSKIRSSSRWN